MSIDHAPGPPARELTEVAPGVWTATAEIWTSLTTVIVAADGACLVVDPGITVAEIAALAHAIRARGWTVVAGFSTHPHWDHVLWSRDLGAVPRWATPRAAVHARTVMAHNLTESEAAAPGHDPGLIGRLTALGDGVGEIAWDGPRAVVVPHDGHCPGHAGLVLPSVGVLLSGDMLSDQEIPLLDLEATDPVADYRAGLDALEAAASVHRTFVLVPGHGHVGDAADLGRRLQLDRRYLDDLEAGRPGADARLGTPWLAAEHARHVRRLRGSRAGAGVDTVASPVGFPRVAGPRAAIRSVGSRSMSVRSELFVADHAGALAHADARDAGREPAPGGASLDLASVDALDLEVLGEVAARAVQYGTGELELQEVDLDRESLFELPPFLLEVLVELGRVEDLALPADVAAQWAADDDLALAADAALPLVTAIVALATRAAEEGSTVYLWTAATNG